MPWNILTATEKQKKGTSESFGKTALTAPAENREFLIPDSWPV